jgi:Protein of unknown function (DUF5674)
METSGVVLLAERVRREVLSELVTTGFGDMVKLVVDVERSLVTLGGQMHADGEQVLLESGSRQADLWGANYFPGRGPEECVEFTSLINIRPSHGNRSMEVQDPAIRQRMLEIIRSLVGNGEDL